MSVVLMLLTPITSVTAQPISSLDSTEIHTNGDFGGFSNGFYAGVNEGSVTDTVNGKKDNGDKKKGTQEESNKGKGDKGGKNGNNGNGEKGNKGNKVSENENKGDEKKGEKKHRNSSSNNSSAPKDPLVNATIDVDEDATALEHRKAVLSVLRDVDAQNGTSKQIERWVNTLNGTLEHVLDGNRVTSADVFRGDKEVVAPLHERASQIAEHLVLSDEKLARQAISDAEHASDVLEDRNISYDEAAVSENITAAREAFDRANRVRNRSMPGAIEHYRRAWTHAQRALDIMDEAAAPTVSIETRDDLPHNGTIESTIAGTIFDVRPHELAAEIEINGSNRTLSLTAETEPATAVEFNTTVTLDTQLPNESRVYVVNVSARDPGVDVADNGYESEDWQDVHAEQQRSDVVVLDGDGLPDIYELNVTGSDPFNPDSDSTATTTNDSADGIIDGAEDFDNDTLISYIEFQAGTDPLDNDTDEDKLPDGFEHSWPTLDPTTADTNANGRPDSKEDPDDDNLENLREFELGTSILSNDTDRDGLNDSVEVQPLGTDPTAADTDDDNLTDSDELDLGTDPLNPDTDGDGVPDGDETYTTTATDDETNVSVQLTGQGNAAKGVSITEKPNYHNTSGVKKGPVVQISNSTAMENATVSIPYNESVKSNDEEHLSMFKYNRTSGIWDPLNSTVDSRNGTVSATVNSVSHFAVFNETRWNDLTTIEPKEGISFENASLECEGACTVEGSVLVIGQGAETGSVGTFASTGPGLDPDRDDDGVLNDHDNCVDTYNPDQSDSDGDGVGDACDDEDPYDPKTDSDGDLIPDSSDNCVYYPNTGQADADGDGKGNPCDSDDDNDSISDGNDNCQFVANPGQQDRDGDGRGAVCDSDEPIYEIAEMKFPIPLEPETVKLDLAYRVEDVESGYYPELTIESQGTTLTRTLGSTDWDVETVDVTGFKGQTITVSVDVPEQTTVRLKNPTVIKDTDGDGIYDYLEADESYYPGLEGGTIKTNYEREDTDDEGLKDGVEITYGLVPPGDYGADGDDPLVRKVIQVNSRPDAIDSDGDGLDDFEEQYVWNTDSLQIDSDSDGFSDAVDEKPLTENEPPEVELTSINYKEHVFVTVSDESSISSVVVNGYYNPPIDDSFWNKSYPGGDPYEYPDGSLMYYIPIYQHGVLNEHPERYYVNATDANGATMIYEIEPSDNNDGVAKIASVGVAATVSGEATSSVVLFEGLGAASSVVTTGGLVVVGVAGLAWIDYQSTTFEPDQVVETSQPVAPTEPVDEYTLSDGTVVTLSTGFYEAELGYERGFGLKYSTNHAGLSEEEIEDILDNPVEVIKDGDVTRIIGETPDGKEVLLIIVAGELVRVYTGEYLAEEDDYCNERKIFVPSKKENDHPYKDGITKNDIKNVIKNPAKVLKDPNFFTYYYVGQAANGIWFALIITDQNPHITYWVSTAYTYKSLEKALEELTDKRKYNADKYSC